MARAPSGHVEWHGDADTGHWRTRATDANGKRVWLNLPHELRQRDAARAKRVALLMQMRARTAAKAAPPAEPIEGESVEAYLTRWTADRAAAGLTNTALDDAQLRKHLVPALGARPITAVTRADLERVVEGLDDQVRARALSWKTATNVWGLARKLFNDAATSKRLALRVLTASPARDVPGPDRGKRRAKQFLWPSELLTLVACERVPLHWRRLYAVAVYLGARAGELGGLRARDIDRTRWVVSIAEAVTTRGTPSKATRRAPKTDAGVRSFSAEPAVRPLLDTLCAEAPEGPLLRPFRTDGPNSASVYLQRHLAVAGVTRTELFATTETRKRITFHDLRATFCTWSAIRGDEPLKIRARAGHEDLETTMGYVRVAELLDRELVGEVFPALPRLDSSPDSSPGEGCGAESLAPQADTLRPQRDSKPLPAPGDTPSPQIPGVSLPATPGDTGGTRGDTSPAGTNAGTNPTDALRAALDAALAGGDLDLAAELLALLRARGAHLRRVV